jgi:hypothetical protein
MSGAQKFNNHLDPKEHVSRIKVWRPYQFEQVTHQFQVVSRAHKRPHQTMLKVQLWHKQHLKDQTEFMLQRNLLQNSKVGDELWIW